MKNVQRSIKAVRSADQRFGNQILDKILIFQCFLKKSMIRKIMKIYFCL